MLRGPSQPAGFQSNRCHVKLYKSCADVLNRPGNHNTVVSGKMRSPHPVQQTTLRVSVMTDSERDKTEEDQQEESLEEFRPGDTGESTLPELTDIETVQSTDTLGGMFDWGEMPGIVADDEDQNKESIDDAANPPGEKY